MIRLIFLFFCMIAVASAGPDLCVGSNCAVGLVCRMVELCTPNCVAIAVCVQPATTTQPTNPCAVGNPLITEFGLERTCQIDGGNCPSNLGCYVSAGAVEGRCCATGTTPPINNKPGTCPTNSGFGVCFNFCAGDSNCLGDTKCCFNGCGMACVLPQSTAVTTTVAPATTAATVRPGTCPTARYGYHGTCTSTCASDATCPLGQKCCSTGCGFHCTALVVPVKSGMCPIDDGYGYCHAFGNQCAQDTDCTGSLKCCKSRCGKRCINPLQQIHGKSGTCPYGPLSQTNNYNYDSLFCFGFCKSDYDCFGASKCCLSSDGCSRMCMVPYAK